jgi:dsRNA-specific ribonuclease
LTTDPDWPEGYLTTMKQGYVDNSRLAQAALNFGLDRYIITESMSLVHWRPKYVEDHLQPSNSITATRKMATKTLADVVESLIGVSYLDGGLPKALQCIELFVPMKHDKKWYSVEQAREKLNNSTPVIQSLPPTRDRLETLLGYTFRNKALLTECMTHASYNLPGTSGTLERLEFFGDSLVEYLVVRRLYAVTDPQPLDNWQMHLIRTALVNGDFLGFLVMEASTTITHNDILAEDNEVSVHAKQEEMPLWRFMRYHSSDLGTIMKSTERRHQALRGQIRTALQTAARYPWALLAHLQLQKFYSDLFEAVLGAIYIDSGSFDECDRFLERIGLLRCLERILQDGVNCLHPKEELGQLAVDKGVEYKVEVEDSEGEEGVPGSGSLKCTVLIGDLIAGEVTGGVSREEVKTRAAERVVKLYDENGGKWWW